MTVEVYKGVDPPLHPDDPTWAAEFEMTDAFYIRQLQRYADVFGKESAERMCSRPYLLPLLK